MIDLSIVTINYNTEDLTLACVESILKNTTGINYEIVLINNGNKKPLNLPKSSKIRLINTGANLGFAGGNNAGMKAAKGKYVVLLNNDTYMSENSLGEMVAWMRKNPKVGISTCKLKNPDGTNQTTGGYFPTLSRVFFWMILQDFPLMDDIATQFHPKKNKEVVHELDWVGGTAFFLKREVFEKIGYIDEEYFMYTEETDFCFRAKQAGFRVFFNPDFSITHIGGASSGSDFPVLSEYKNVKLFYRKHYPSWQYPILRAILKIGALGRIVLFGILVVRKDKRDIYAKAFIQA